MREELKLLLNNSYAPYSKYCVSSIVVMNDGRKFNGVNVENASYGATICAERSAILAAVTNGYRKDDFKELHVMVSSDKIGTPCFECRQVICEFMNDMCDVYLYANNLEAKLKVKDLCPYPFNEENL